MEVINQLCIKSFEITALNGDYFKAKKGKTYTTTIPDCENENITLLSNYWVRVPKDHFVIQENK